MDVIDTAGLAAQLKNATPDKRRLAIREIRATIRRSDATDDEVDDALDALIELAKD